MLLPFCIFVAYGKFKLLIRSYLVKLKQKIFIEKMLGCIYKAFKQINEFKEVIRSLATGPNVGNKNSAKE